MITVSINNDAAVPGKLGRVAPAVRERLKAETTRLSARLIASIREDYLSGQALNGASGRLANALSAEALADGDAIRARVALDLGAAKYGAFWESGFERMLGAGVRGGMRNLLGRARERYVLKHPAGVKQFEARPFLHPALADMREEIVASLTDAGTCAVAEVMQ